MQLTVTSINILRVSVPENALWVLPRLGKRNTLGEDPDETEYLKNKEMRMPEFLILDKKGFIFLGPSLMIPY